MAFKNWDHSLPFSTDDTDLVKVWDRYCSISKDCRAVLDGLEEAHLADNLPVLEYGECHHMLPLCVYGSVHEDVKYKQLPSSLHIQVHAALLLFFGGNFLWRLHPNHLLSLSKTISSNHHRYLNQKDIPDDCLNAFAPLLPCSFAPIHCLFSFFLS